VLLFQPLSRYEPNERPLITQNNTKEKTKCKHVENTQWARHKHWSFEGYFHKQRRKRQVKEALLERIQINEKDGYKYI